MSSEFPIIPSFNDLPAGDHHLREVPLESMLAYQGYYLKLMQDQARLPDGKTAGREYLIHPGAVAIVPILPDGRILLERQYRYPMHQAFIEIPAGKLDLGEDPSECAKRELQEETGFNAQSWKFLGKIHPVISHSTEFIDIYCAQELSFIQSNLDEGEFMDIFGATIQEIDQWIKEGQITDVKTIIGVNWVKEYLNALSCLQIL
jgi:ADP-ribose pyrophosphatase